MKENDALRAPTVRRIGRRRWALGVAAAFAAALKPGLAAAADPAALAVDPAAAHRAQLCSPANPTGVGLRGEYFAGTGLRGPKLLMRVDSVVEFDSGLEWPVAQAGRRPQSARWTGWIKAPFAGKYRLDAEPRSAVVTLGVQRVQDGRGGAVSAVDLEPGRFYPIEVVVDPLPGPGSADRVVLRWTAPHGARYVVPRNLLFLPTETVRTPRP
jgi:hypothetical protein